MSGVITTLEGLNAVSQATGTYDFISYSNFYKTGNVKGLRLIKSAGKTLGTTGTWGEIIPYTGEVVGGASKGVSAINFSSNASGGVTASRSGALISIPAVQLVGAILAGLGLGIVAYEANPALWCEVSNKIFSVIPGYEPITEDELPHLTFTTLFKNGKTHVPDYLIKHSADALNELNAFSTIQKPLFNIKDLVVGEKVNVNMSGYNYTSIQKVMSEVISNVPAGTNLPEVSPVTAFSMWLESVFNTGRVTQEQFLSYKCFWFQFGVDTNKNSKSARYYFHLDVFNPTYNECIVLSKSENEDYALVNMARPLLGTVDGFSFFGTAYWYDTGQEWLAGINSSGGLNEYAAIFREMPIGINTFTSTSGTTSIFYGKTSGFNASYIEESGLAGVKILEGAIVPSYFPMDMPSSFPEWWASRIGWSNLNPDAGENPLIDFNYLPLAVPNVSPYANPVETPQAEAQAGAVPATNPEPVVEGTKPVVDNIPDGDLPTGGGGDTPIIPPIPTLGGTATALYTVYNPTKSQLNSLGAYLWSENALTILQQLFQNPLESVIGLHILYASPSIGNAKNIKLGYLDSGVSANEVTNQYINIDCGSIIVPEYFGDARDYSPYTQINVFLPFIGIRQLDTNEIMGGTMSIDYKIDVLTGTCLCSIEVSKLGYSQILYTFEGNCAVQLPLTGADKSRLLTGVIGGAFAGGMIGGTGGAVVGAVKGAVGGIRIQKTGSIGSNAGAMGIKKPYIIITRQKPYDAKNYNEQYGYPANITVQLSSCKGYTRVKDVHLENISVATQEEKNMIETLLKQGVVIN